MICNLRSQKYGGIKVDRGLYPQVFTNGEMMGSWRDFLGKLCWCVFDFSRLCPNLNVMISAFLSQCSSSTAAYGMAWQASCPSSHGATWRSATKPTAPWPTLSCCSPLLRSSSAWSSLWQCSSYVSAGTFTSVSICIDDGHGGMFDEVCMMMIMTMMLLKFFFLVVVCFCQNLLQALWTQKQGWF